MKKVLTFCLAIGICLMFTSTVPSLAQADTMKLNMATFFPPTHDQAKALEGWAKKIEERTDGQVKITLHAGGTLGKGPEIYGNVVNGVADIGNSCFAYYKGRFPVMQAVDLPLGYPTGMVASLAANAYAQQLSPPELNDVKLLYVHAHGPGLLHTTKKPVTTLEDFKGLKIRATGFSGEAVRAMGGAPVSMGQGGAYEALKTGVVEGTMTPIETLKGWKQAEVVKYTTECTNIGYTTAFFVVMNKAKWNKLPADVQQIFEQVSTEWVKVHGTAWDEADEAGRQYTLQQGNEILQLDPAEAARWRKAADQAIDAYAQSTPDGDKNVQAIQEWIKRYAAQ